jgi:hypothetical protein
MLVKVVLYISHIFKIIWMLFFLKNIGYWKKDTFRPPHNLMQADRHLFHTMGIQTSRAQHTFHIPKYSALYFFYHNSMFLTLTKFVEKWSIIPKQIHHQDIYYGQLNETNTMFQMLEYFFLQQIDHNSEKLVHQHVFLHGLIIFKSYYI